MQTNIKKFLAEFWPTLLAAAACLMAALVWLTYFSTSVTVKPMLEQPGVVPFYTTRPASPNPEFGMALGNTLLRMPDEELQRRLDDLNYLGIDWIRIDFGWDNIQPKNAKSFSWASHDRLVRMASQHDLKVLGILTYTPDWAREPGCNAITPNPGVRPKCAPKVAADFARFAGAAAKRYPQVAAWEIWNEPNAAGFWRQILPGNRIGVDPAAYAKLTNLAAAAIKKQSPHTRVVTGGLSHIVSTEGAEGMQTVEFLKAVLPSLDKSIINGIGMHPYTAPASPISPEDWNAYYTLTDGPDNSNVRSVMQAAGWGNKIVWSTEFGATTKGIRQQARTASSSPATLQQYDHVSEDMQAEILKKAIIGWCRKPQVGPLILYTDSDQYIARASGNEAGFGLRRQDGTTKPAYEVVREALQTAKTTCH